MEGGALSVLCITSLSSPHAAQFYALYRVHTNPFPFQYCVFSICRTLLAPAELIFFSSERSYLDARGNTWLAFTLFLHFAENIFPQPLFLPLLPACCSCVGRSLPRPALFTTAINESRKAIDRRGDFVGDLFVVWKYR